MICSRARFFFVAKKLSKRFNVSITRIRDKASLNIKVECILCLMGFPRPSRGLFMDGGKQRMQDVALVLSVGRQGRDSRMKRLSL